MIILSVRCAHQTFRIRKIWILTAALISLGLSAFGKVNDPDPRQAVVAIIMDFEGSYSSVSLDAMKSELERIMRQSAVRLEWRFYQDALGKEIFTSLAVVRFKGECRVGDFLEAREVASSLGLTHMSGDAILPYADVHCDQVRNLVQGELRSQAFPRMEFLLGRALGRVVAHELYHILARTTRHGGSGLAKRVLTPQELLFRDLQFDEPESELIQESVAAWGRPSDVTTDEK